MTGHGQRKILQDAFLADVAKIRRGDIVGFVGKPAKTKKGEISVIPYSTGWFITNGTVQNVDLLADADAAGKLRNHRNYSDKSL